MQHGTDRRVAAVPPRIRPVINVFVGHDDADLSSGSVSDASWDDCDESHWEDVAESTPLAAGRGTSATRHDQQACQAMMREMSARILALERGNLALESAVRNLQLAASSTGFASCSSIAQTIDRAQITELQEWMGDVQLSSSRRLYRASDDGWRPQDFFRCCSQRGPTLTIVKVANTGYVFGAYAAVAWPSRPSHPTPPTAVADPSGRSFLFSLTNGARRPFHLSLRQKGGDAISVDSEFGPCFGGHARVPGQTDQYCNLLLMAMGRDANRHDGNVSNHLGGGEKSYAHQAEPHRGAAPILDENTLAGSQFFAAAEIEVFAVTA